MNFKSALPLLVLISTFSTIEEPLNFQYAFQVVGNSYHPVDQSLLYSYKEELIDQYELLVFGFEERDYGDIISHNISSFEFDENCVASYRNGEILLIIGKGAGPTFKGQLRKNECDESAIREKFYIFELFK